MYDAIVIGARCAGASTAMLLARKGLRVLLVDRARFPSDLPHGHFIHRHGPKRLKHWGLLDRIVATNCPATVTQTSDFGDFPLVAKDLVVDGVALGYGPRRTVLDQILVDAAVEAGAELREGFLVEGLETDGDRIVGIRGRDRRGNVQATEHARITIGADGRNSFLARTVRAPVYEATPTIQCYYFSYWSDVSAEFEMHVRPRERRVIFSFATNDNLYAVFVGWPIAELPQIRSDIEGSFVRALSLAPDLAERLRNGKRAERFYGMVDLPNFFRKPYGSGWALVGDAGCHKDPYLALGICDAFRDAEFLTDAIDDGLSGHQPLDEALAEYEQRRNAAAMPEYQQNIQSARLGPLPPEVYQLRAALRGHQEDTNRFVMARVGMIPEAEFFNPENLRRILDRASDRSLVFTR